MDSEKRGEISVMKKQMKLMNRKTQRTNNVYNIFKCVLLMNQYRFKDFYIDTVIEYLIDFVDIDNSYIITDVLKDRIKKYCESHDTGIYY